MACAAWCSVHRAHSGESMTLHSRLVALDIQWCCGAGIFDEALAGGVRNLNFGGLSTSLGTTMYRRAAYHAWCLATVCCLLNVHLGFFTQHMHLDSLHELLTPQQTHILLLPPYYTPLLTIPMLSALTTITRVYRYQFRIPPYYTLLVRSLTILEGIALASDPNYKVLGAAYPWIARRLLTDESAELRATLRRLLYTCACYALVLVSVNQGCHELQMQRAGCCVSVDRATAAHGRAAGAARDAAPPPVHARILIDSLIACTC